MNMQEIRTKLAGVFAPMVTPFKDDKLLLDRLAANIDKMNSSALRGYFVLGTNGEFKAVTAEERPRIIETVVKYRTDDKVVLVGTGAESTKETLDFTRQAADLGANMVSLLMPHFFAKKMSDDLLADFIREVADASPVPVLLYNNPSVAADVTITPSLIQKVASHPNIVGMKDSSHHTFRENLRAAGDSLFVLAGSANYFFELLELGGIGGVLSLANVFPDNCAELYRAYVDGRTEEAHRLSERLVDLNGRVSGIYGVAGVKAAMDMVGLTGGDPRRPLRPLTPEQKRQLENELRKCGYLLQ